MNRFCGSMWVFMAITVGIVCGLNNFASKDMPGKQGAIQDTVNKILTAVGGPAVAG